MMSPPADVQQMIDRLRSTKDRVQLVGVMFNAPPAVRKQLAEYLELVLSQA